MSMKNILRKKSYQKKLQNNGYIFVIPSVILFCVFLIFPMFNGFYISLFKWNLIGDMEFVGLQNFINILSDRFVNSFKITIHFTALSVIFLILISFCLALAFNTKIKGKNIIQSLIFIPVILITVAVAIVWQYMFQSFGIITYYIREFIGINIPWLTSTSVTPYALILVYVWKYTGFYMVIFIAGLLDIPEEYYESASIDGASFWGKLLHITIPQLKNTFILVFISSFIFCFGSFELQYVLTNGGPGRSTEILSLLIYKEAFSYGRFGNASAFSVIYFLILIIFSIFQLKLFKTESR